MWYVCRMLTLVDIYFPTIMHFDFSTPSLNFHLFSHTSIRFCRSWTLVENRVISSAYAIELYSVSPILTPASQLFKSNKSWLIKMLNRYGDWMLPCRVPRVTSNGLLYDLNYLIGCIRWQSKSFVQLAYQSGQSKTLNMSVCCTFWLILVNKYMLTASSALLLTQIIRGTFKYFANLIKKLWVLHYI